MFDLFIVEESDGIDLSLGGFTWKYERDYVLKELDIRGNGINQFPILDIPFRKLNDDFKLIITSRKYPLFEEDELNIHPGAYYLERNKLYNKKELENTLYDTFLDPFVDVSEEERNKIRNWMDIDNHKISGLYRLCDSGIRSFVYENINNEKNYINLIKE